MVSIQCNSIHECCLKSPPSLPNAARAMEEFDATYDSDEEADFSKMDMVGV